MNDNDVPPRPDTRVYRGVNRVLLAPGQTPPANARVQSCSGIPDAPRAVPDSEFFTGLMIAIPVGVVCILAVYVFVRIVFAR